MLKKMLFTTFFAVTGFALLFVFGFEAGAQDEGVKKKKKKSIFSRFGSKKKKEKDPYYRTPYNYHYGKFKRKFRRGKFTIGKRGKRKDKRTRDIELTEDVDNYLVYQEVSTKIPETFPYKIKWWYYIKGMIPSRVWVAGAYIYVQTSSKLFYCLDRRNGLPLWVLSFKRFITGSPAALPEADDELGKVFVLVGKRLFCIDIQEGEISFHRDLDFLPSTGPKLTGRGLFIGSWDKYMYAVSEKDGHWKWRYYCGSYVFSTPTIRATFKNATMTYFGDEGNYLQCLSLDRTHDSLDWSFKTRGPIVSAPVWSMKDSVKRRVKNKIKSIKIPTMLYFSSRDYNLYAMNLEQSKLQWQ